MLPLVPLTLRREEQVVFTISQDVVQVESESIVSAYQLGQVSRSNGRSRPTLVRTQFIHRRWSR